MSPLTDRYARHSPFTTPGAEAALLRTLPEDLPDLAGAVRGLVLHHTTPGLSPERRREADLRWLERVLRRLRELQPGPLTAPRPEDRRVVGCCRDSALLLVAALRERGQSARVRVGFSAYFAPGFHFDHVVAEVWMGARWVWVDPGVDPGDVPVDVLDLPPGAFVTAAGAWQAWRRGEAAPETFGVAPGFLTGASFIRNSLLRELSALNGWELLQWDYWGLM